jgi:mannose-1-phosphate guanylyltransferase
MALDSNRWALVLAAGSGTRLSSLTTDSTGSSVPKQFCSLSGGASLLEDALARAAVAAGVERTIVVVAEQHRRYWEGALAGVPAENVIVQPHNRGTANGILLGVSAIGHRDPDAVVAVVPSDHYVEAEDVLARVLGGALSAVANGGRRDSLGFLGVQPEFADPELGYIVRGAPLGDGSAAVARFVEKPSHDEAAKLLRRRALWTSFILVARAETLMGIVERRFPDEVAAFRALWRFSLGATELPADMERLYAGLREIDFSRGVVEGTDAPLHVVGVPACGWSDLGTPQRVAQCLARARPVRRAPRSSMGPHFNLADALARLASRAPAAQIA